MYEVNERIVLDGKWKYGRLYQVYVSATNVGTMTINFDPDLNTNMFMSNDPIVNKKPLEGVRLNAG